MNTHALIPLVASIAYIPLFVILLVNRPWDRKQKFFLLFLVSAFLWSLSDVFFRSDFFMPDKVLLVKVVICILIWMLIEFHYFICTFFQSGPLRRPWAYIFLVSTIALAASGYIPLGIEIINGNINIDYGIWIVVIGLVLLFTLGIRDMYSLLQRRRVSPDPVERNQIGYLLGAISILIVFVLFSITPRGGELPVSHVGNLITACILTYAVVAHRLLDVRVVLRRGLIWFGLVITGIAAYLLLFLLAHLVISFDIEPRTVAVATVIAMITAVIIYKLSGIFHAKIEQVFVGERYQYRRQLSDFISKIHDMPTLEQFGSRFTSLLSQSIGCQRSSLLFPQAESGDFVSRFIYPPVQENPMSKLKLKYDSPVVTWLKRENTILPERNLNIFPEFQSIWQEERENIRSVNAKIFIPIMNKQDLVAVLAISDKRDGKLYTIEDVDLLEAIASRVAASMEKEYFNEQLREQGREIRVLNRLTTIITSSLSIQEIFEGFAEELNNIVDVDFATISLIDGDQLEFSALSSTVSSAWQTRERIPLEGTAAEWIAREKRSLYEPNLPQHHKFWTGERYLRQGIRSIIYLPLAIKDNTIGSLVVASRRVNAYGPKQIELLEQVALQIATPIENAQLYTKAEHRSRIDELTGLFNRRHFEERLKEELARHSRHSEVFSLFLLDLDSFKTYNDIYGHPSGDRLLNEIGRIIKRTIRSADQAFRYGGDEFIIILPQTTTDDAYSVAERVREQVARGMEAKEIAVTCSIGLASYPSDAVIAGELITIADTALYYAKRTGGNRVYLSSKILSEPVVEEGTYARGTGLSAVYALASAVEAKDHYTYGHSKKVNTYAVALAEAIDLSPDDVSKISTGALLHDIGKIGVSDKILNKKGKLNAEDWEIIKSHPRLGANIVSNVPNLVPCISSILYHHERWDGTGYPEGLKSEEIPVEARILAIADSFSAMTSARPYRDAFCAEKAIERLKQAAGTQFDPKLLEVFVGIMEAGSPQKAKVS